MPSTYEILDLSTWKRAVHCEVFRKSRQPHYEITFDTDVTKFHATVRERGLSFTFSMIYATARCANAIENFRYRFQNGRAVLYRECGTVFTILNRETELFKFVSVPMRPTLAEYEALARKTSENQKAYFTGPPANEDFIFSPIPWISFSHISRTDSGDAEQAAPMFDFGKYVRRGRRLKMPFSVRVHHSFADALQIAQFAELLQQTLDTAQGL